jgi:uncharacterized membrane protein YhaH (DUF805 family)
MSWTQLLFSFKGRIRRLYFWVASLVVGVVVGMFNSSQSYGMGEINPEGNEFEPTGPLSIWRWPSRICGSISR